ncbi:GIY-YIG nuclease family protein [Arenicella xantha]|uniref:Putative endonuclease n=1 Tax=Arenicella xantha TaxID=644221 RepID=A0A395JNP9_9GAMM|nr:GIY-YIG nuclease family protein [Arenicella xantha]RBP53271.1 putative endonuclease [Arenicella xantha]
MNWVVYVLRCADDSLYTGITKDIERRIYEHNECDQKGAKYTRARRPVKLVYQEPHEDRASASQREHAIKQLSRSQKLGLVNAS